MFFFGIKDVYEQSIITRTYVPIEGTFYDYEIYDSDEDGTTYSLIYRYEVEGVTYQVQTIMEQVLFHHTIVKEKYGIIQKILKKQFFQEQVAIVH